MKFTPYALEWLERLSRIGSVEPSTILDYRRNIVAWSPWLTMDVADVTRRDVEDAIAGMLSQGRVPSTVKKRMVTISRMFDDAVEYGDVRSNPLSKVRPPKQRKSQKNYLPPEERERLKARIESSNLAITVAAGLALWCGLRNGEVCAIKASDLNLESGVGWVRRAVGRADGGTYIKDAKSGQMRDFPIPEPLSLVLGRWMDSNSIRGDSYLLTGTDRWSDTIVMGRKWSSLCEIEGFRGVLGKPPTFHDLRHTYATVAIAAGVDVKTVSSVLGHASSAMTLDVYAVSDPVAKKMSADVMSRAI